MGGSHSLDAFFGSENRQAHSEQADVYQYLHRVEKTLWLTTPWWEQAQNGGGALDVDTANIRAGSPSKLNATPRDPFKKLSPQEALVVIPSLMDEAWISPLVALADSLDPIARCSSLALLSRIVNKDSVAKIFLAVGGMEKMMTLLDSQDRQATHLALEVIYALCAGSASVALSFCNTELVGRLTVLTRADSPELVLASLKILRITLQQSAAKAEMQACKMLSVLMELMNSPHAEISKTAVVCVGLSLPNAENLAEILQLGCIDAFLRLMTPTNPNADAVIFALSLIADETDAIFPREQTTTMLARMLESLRGAAKRSAAASATSFLFASLAKSNMFHAAICNEANLGILAKLLVGGSPGVLGATAYALGIVALHANDRVRQTLFQVDAPQNLIQLVIISLAPSGAGHDEKVARLAIFALATIISESLVSRAGPLVRPELLLPPSMASEPLRASTIAACAFMQGTDFLPHVYARAIKRLGPGSTYALKLLSALSVAPHVREHMCDPMCVTRMLEYLSGASAVLLPSLLVLFLECCGCDDACDCDKRLPKNPVPEAQEISEASGDSVEFCQLVEKSPEALQILSALFETHQPESLLGLAPLLAALVAHSAPLRTHMSSSDFFIDQALSAATRLNLGILHEQVLCFLERLTAHKNQRALEQLYASDPDRVANLLQASSASHRVQLLATTLLRRLFKRFNARDVPSRAAQRHLSKLLVTSNSIAPDIEVAIAACRVWGNLFQFEDKRLAFVQIPDAVPGLLLLLHRGTSSQSGVVSNEQSTQAITATNGDPEDLEAQEKRRVLAGLKPLYWTIRSVFRMTSCETARQAIVAAPHFLGITELFPHPCEPVARLAIDTLSNLARATTPGLRRALAVPAVLNAIQQLLRDRDRASRGRGILALRHVLRFLGLLARKDAAIQHLVVESRLLEALVLLLQSPSTSLDAELLAEALDALAWVCSAARSLSEKQTQAELDDEAATEIQAEGDAPARSVIATAKMVDLALRYAESAFEHVACASLHLLQRLACEQPHVPRFVFEASGAAVVMRALQERPERVVRRRACTLVRHLVHRHDGNRQKFQELGATSFLVVLVTSANEGSETPQEQITARKLQIKGLQALAALCEGSDAAARACKQEMLECEQSALLLRLVRTVDTGVERLCAAWTRALAMGALGSSTNQRRLVRAGIVPVLTQLLLRHLDGRVRVPTAQLLAYLAQTPENRGIITNEGGDSVLSAIIACLQSELPGLQRYAALFIAHVATRHEGNKVRLGAAGAAAPLVDRLSSQRLHVLENVLLAVVKLGSHAGNKVKLGGKVCFEKLLALVHHETLAVAKGAARALAVLVAGNDANKRFLLQCEAPVVAELSALLKGANGTIVESAMLVLGELAPMPAQALELSRCVDVLAVVKLLAHVNPRIARAALLVVRHLTRESFNKTRFGLRECVDTLLMRLRLGLNSDGGAEELELVELAITCLANLSFAPANAERIAETRDLDGGSLLLLLQLAVPALPTPTKDYLSTKEAARLASRDTQLNSDGSSKRPSSDESHQSDASHSDVENVKARTSCEQQEGLDEDEIQEGLRDHSLSKRETRGDIAGREKIVEAREVEGVAQGSVQALDFTAFPSLQTAVLEQTLLVISNCAEHYRTARSADALAVAVLCQALRHPSELVARCACYTLACWCKGQHTLQDSATRRGALPALAQLLPSPNLVVVEAAAYALAKLAARGDNPTRLLALDVPSTLVQGILRKQANVPHDRLLDRAVRLLGTLTHFARVRQALKGEEIIADVLTPLLQLHPQVLSKNLSRLVLGLLAEDSLKFFLPKKTVALLRACFVHHSTSGKTVRNVIRVFKQLAVVEEHKTTITLEDSGETLARIVRELRVEDGIIGENADTVLELLANIAGTRKIAAILHECDVYAELPPYLTVATRQSNDPDTAIPPPPPASSSTEVEALGWAALEGRHLHAVQVAGRLCEALSEQAERRLSELEFVRFLVPLLRTGLPQALASQEKQEDLLSRAATASTTLSLLNCECLGILCRLCPFPRDEQMLVEEGAVEVFVAYLELWLAVASGTSPELFPSESSDSLVQGFAVSLASIVLTLTSQTPNRELLVQTGGFPMILGALGLGTSELSDTQRDQLAEALARLSPLPTTVSYLEASPHLVTPLFRFMVAPPTQQQPRLLVLALRVFADVMETSPASRAYVLLVTGGTIQPLPFLLACLEHSSGVNSEEKRAKLFHAMRSLQRLATDEAVAWMVASLDGLSAVGGLLTLELPAPPSHDDRLETVQLMATETLGYMAFFGHAPCLRLERAAVARLLAQANFARDERVTPESAALSIWTLALLATPQASSTGDDKSQRVTQTEVEAAAACVRGWVVSDAYGLDVLIACGLRARGHLVLPMSVTADVLAILTASTEQQPEAEAVLDQLIHKRVCTPVAALLEAVEPIVRVPALQLLAQLLPKHSWASNEPSVDEISGDHDPNHNQQGSIDENCDGDVPSERWSAILMHLVEWMQVYARDLQTSSLSELRQAYGCLSVLTAHLGLAAKFRRDKGPQGLMDLMAAALHHFGGKKLPSRPESLLLIRKESTNSDDATGEVAIKAAKAAERAKEDWLIQFETVLHVLRACRRIMTFSQASSDQALELHVPRALDNLVLLHDRRLLDEALRCMLHLANLHGEKTELLFSSDRTIARLKGLLQSESRPIQARVTPLLALMAAQMPTLPGLCGMDGILVLADLAVSSGASIFSGKREDPASLERRVFEDSCAMLLALFSHDEGVVLAFDVAQVVAKCFGIIERMAAVCVASSEAEEEEAPELFELPLRVLVKVSEAPQSHTRYLELLPRICRLLDGVNGPARLTGRWCEMLLSVLFNVFGCPYGGDCAKSQPATETMVQGERALLPQLLPLERWVSVANEHPASGRLVVELLRAFVANGDPASPYSSLFNNGENIIPLLVLAGSPITNVAIPASQLLLSAARQREVRIALTVADGVPALVVALRNATSATLQRQLLSLLLDLARGDSEVQALLLSAPGCVERLVEFVQERMNAHATPSKNKAMNADDDRPSLSCALLAELSRALHGPERIVEANGHVPLLALSIQQQQEENYQAAQTTVQILTNLATAGVTVAPGLVASKLPAHFLACLLAEENSASLVNAKHALPLTWRLALSGLLALAKANRAVRAELTESHQLVVLLERLLQPQESSGQGSERPTSVTRDALLLLHLMSTARCAILAKHTSPEILTRICDVMRPHVLRGTRQQGGDARDDEATPAEATRGLKLLANLLDVTENQEHKPSWHPEKLLDLTSLLESRVAAHQAPKLQVPALRVLRGAFALATKNDGPSSSFYFPLTPQLLADLLTLLLVSASRQHREIAERVVVCAFRGDPERARASVGDNHILEQLLIVFTQPGDGATRQASGLAAALTQVLYVSIARGFVVSQRFLAKVPTLLGSYLADTSPEGCGDHNQSVKRALSVYLGFAYANSPPLSTTRSSIVDMLRSEGASNHAMGALLEQLLLVHTQLCLTPVGNDGTISEPPKARLDSEDIMLWTCIVESVNPLTPTLAALFSIRASLTTWFCLLRDWFHHVEATEFPDTEVLRNACQMLSVVIQLNPTPLVADDDSNGAPSPERKSELCARCLAVLSCGTGPETPRVIEGALQALLDARESWGDALVLAGCCEFKGTSILLPRLLRVFHLQEREADGARHLVLKFLLLLASTGHFVEEIKATGVRTAVENNPRIPAADKALAVALLGLLGYSADLNEEFALALMRSDGSNALAARREHVAYLLRFLERYSLTHGPTREQAIDHFMTELVADAEKVQKVATASERGPEEDTSEQEVAERLAVDITSDCLAALMNLAGGKVPSEANQVGHGFGAHYLARWDLNALLAVAFTRQRGNEDNDFQERPRLALAQIAQVLELAAHVRSKLDDDSRGTVAVGQIDERWICNAFTLVDCHLSTTVPNSHQQSNLLLVEQVLALLHWLAERSTKCFTDIHRYAGLLRSFLAPLTPVFRGDDSRSTYSESDTDKQAMELFLSLVEMVANAPSTGADTIASVEELLGDLLTFVYAQVDGGLRHDVRSRLLVCVLVVLQRAGDAGRAACAAYERALQQILWHVHASHVSELQAHCSWELLGSLTGLDPAITALFNLDAIPVLLRECGCDLSGPARRPSTGSWRLSRRAIVYRQAEALKCLSRAATTHDEVLMKIGEAPGIAAVLFDALAATPMGNTDTNGGGYPALSASTHVQTDSAGTQAHAAHLIARIASQEDLRASLVSPEQISLLIESLESVHLPVVLHALQALAHLCAFALCLDALVRHATVPVLAQILVSPLAETTSRREIEACVVALLGKMCARSETVSRRVVSSNLLPKLRSFLVVEKQQSHQYLQQEPRSEETGVCHNAVWVVSSLSKDGELVPKLAAHDMLETLCDQLLSYNPRNTQRKALGAMSRLVGSTAMDSDTLVPVIGHVVETVRRNVPVSEAQRTVANALAVFVAIAKAGKSSHHQTQRHPHRPQRQQQLRRAGDASIEEAADETNARQLLLEGDGVRVALELLGATDPRVKLQAFLVIAEFVDDHPNPRVVRELLLGSEDQGGSHALLSLVRAISDETRSIATSAATLALRKSSKSSTLLVALTLLNVLLADEALKTKLTPTTYDVVLQVVVATPASPSATAYQTRVLGEALKALATMTRADQIAELCPEAALVSSIGSLVNVLRGPQVGGESGASANNVRLNALFLLVNYASSTQCRDRMARGGALQALLAVIQAPGGSGAAQDDQLVQLALLGVALMTAGGVSDAAAVVELTAATGTLVRLLNSKSASIQANAVWVVSNISTEASLKNAIVGRGGPTALQALLNDNMSTADVLSKDGNDAAKVAARPSSSAMRIREYAPKAIKSLGFAPITAPPPSSSAPKTSSSSN